MSESLWNPRQNRRNTLIGIAAVLIGSAVAAALSRLVSRPEERA
jgi:hypothetical protein